MEQIVWYNPGYLIMAGAVMFAFAYMLWLGSGGDKK